MFEKAAYLIQTDGLVIPKPGSSDGSYVVAGTCNRIFCVTPGKGGSFKCDRTCINSTTNICEYVIAVAVKCGKLPDFVKWFKRSKSRPSFTALALTGPPKSAGKKPSKRKRSNKRKAEIESTVDILDENDRSTRNFNFQLLGHVPAASQVPHPTYEEAVQTDGITNGYFSQQPSTGQSVLNIPLYCNVTQQQVSNNFLLKWVNGTTFSKCYGCKGRIPNPPTTPLENLIIARKDVRYYRHRTTNQLQCSSHPQNLHFRLSLRCVVANQPMFLRSDLKTFQEMYAYLTPEHKMKLFSKFNVVAW